MNSRAPKQLGFAILEKNAVKSFGGDLLKKSNPKGKRPITTKRSMHLVMRSSLAKGNKSLLKNEKQIRFILTNQSTRFGVKIYKYANAGNHLHMIIRPSSRKAFHKFIKAVSGLIARLILKAERGQPVKQQFWDQRPFTRIIEWGREFTTVSSYLTQNILEAIGFINYQPRKNRFRSTASGTLTFYSS